MLIYLECNADEALVMSLGIPRKNIKHQSNKGNVCNNLEKSSEVSIGLIDKDPLSKQPTIWNKSKILIAKKLDIEVLLTPNNHKIIVLHPRLEEWFEKAAKDSDVDLSGLLNKGEKLKDHINNRLPQFRIKVNELIEKKSKSLIYLKSFLS